MKNKHMNRELVHFLLGAGLTLLVLVVTPVGARYLAQMPPTGGDTGGTAPASGGTTGTFTPTGGTAPASGGTTGTFTPTGGTAPASGSGGSSIPTTCPPGETGTPPNCSGAINGQQGGQGQPGTNNIGRPTQLGRPPEDVEGTGESGSSASQGNNAGGRFGRQGAGLNGSNIGRPTQLGRPSFGEEGEGEGEGEETRSRFGVPSKKGGKQSGSSFSRPSFGDEGEGEGEGEETRSRFGVPAKKGGKQSGSSFSRPSFGEEGEGEGEETRSRFGVPAKKGGKQSGSSFSRSSFGEEGEGEGEEADSSFFKKFTSESGRKSSKRLDLPKFDFDTDKQADVVKQALSAHKDNKKSVDKLLKKKKISSYKLLDSYVGDVAQVGQFYETLCTESDIDCSDQLDELSIVVEDYQDIAGDLKDLSRAKGKKDKESYKAALTEVASALKEALKDLVDTATGELEDAASEE